MYRLEKEIEAMRGNSALDVVKEKIKPYFDEIGKKTIDRAKDVRELKIFALGAILSRFDDISKVNDAFRKCGIDWLTLEGKPVNKCPRCKEPYLKWYKRGDGRIIIKHKDRRCWLNKIESINFKAV